MVRTPWRAARGPDHRVAWLAAVTAAAATVSVGTFGMGCLPDNPALPEAGEDSSETADGDSDTGAPVVDSGLLGCPSGATCTIVALSQTLDDRVELFTAPNPGSSTGPTPRYRGALDLDLVPNPGGDISGELLDEPYGLAWDGAALHVLVGHYPTRVLGSLLSFPAASFADVEAGSLVPASAWFAGGEAVGLDVGLRPLGRTEPLSLVVHPGSGQLLIAVFANDLQLPDSMWASPSEVLALDPSAPETAPTVVDAGCVGAWSITTLDPEAQTVALACDGDERVVIFDAAALTTGGGLSLRCTADIPFSNKRVRTLAADGLGGVVVGEHPAIVSGSEDARMWWFDGDCGLRGFRALDGPSSWTFREIVPIPGAELRWLLARTDGDERGVVILAGDLDTGEVAPCGRLDGLDAGGANAWTAVGGAELLRPHALGLRSDGRGLAVSTAPANYDNAGPGWGSLWWTELDWSEGGGAGDGDACDAIAVDPVELGAAAPAVDAQLPQTWRRGPDVLTLIELEGGP